MMHGDAQVEGLKKKVRWIQDHKENSITRRSIQFPTKAFRSLANMSQTSDEWLWPGAGSWMSKKSQDKTSLDTVTIQSLGINTNLFLIDPNSPLAWSLGIYILHP